MYVPVVCIWFICMQYIYVHLSIYYICYICVCYMVVLGVYMHMMLSVCGVRLMYIVWCASDVYVCGMCLMYMCVVYVDTVYGVLHLKRVGKVDG